MPKLKEVEILEIRTADGVTYTVTAPSGSDVRIRHPGMRVTRKDGDGNEIVVSDNCSIMSYVRPGNVALFLLASGMVYPTEEVISRFTWSKEDAKGKAGDAEGGIAEEAPILWEM